MSVATFGITAAGQTVHQITLTSGDLTVRLLTLGAILQDVRLAGVDHGLTLGGPDLAAYDDGPMAHFGAIMGPVANRISQARTRFDGRVLRFDANYRDRHTLHGGNAAMHRQVWKPLQADATRAVLQLTQPDGLGGFPGNRTVTATFAVTEPACLTMTLSAETDAPTLMNLANHSYWSLDGTGSFAGHSLRLAADSYLPADADFVATGERRPVAGTEYDFRRPRKLAPASGAGLDTCFCLSEARRELSFAAELTGQGGVTLRMETTEPGLQVYDARGQATPPCPGWNGTPYAAYAGLALEAQFWPDAPNKPGFPSIRLEPGDAWRQVTRWGFAAGDHP